MERVYINYPYSSRVNISRVNLQYGLSVLDSKPLLTSNWLVTISPKGLINENLVTISQTSNTNIFLVRNKSELTSYKDLFITLKINYYCVDNVNVQESEVINYVMESLGISLNLSKYLCNRHRYSFGKNPTYSVPRIMESVMVLSTLDKVDKKSIQEYTNKVSTVSLYALSGYIIGSDKSVPLKKIVALVYDYRYAMSFLVKFLKTQISQTIAVYDFIDKGYLSLDNYIEFKNEEVFKQAVEDITEYGLKKIIENRKTISFERLYLLQLLFEDIGTNKYQIYKILNLLYL